jgi:ribosomal protein S18 acetylase RimI-like enzyme
LREHFKSAASIDSQLGHALSLVSGRAHPSLTQRSVSLTLIHDEAAVRPPEPRVGTARRDDATQLTAALAAAFYDDPVFRWFARDDRRRRDMLPGFFDVFVSAYLTNGDTYADADVLGAALWAAPGTDPVADEPVCIQRLEEIAGIDAPRLFEVVELFEAQAPQEPHYHLQFLGVRPERQGAGLGGALIAPMLARCDRDGTPAYLEATSDRNRALYERHGFRAHGAIALPNGPDVWRMWRDPIAQ